MTLDTRPRPELGNEIRETLGMIPSVLDEVPDRHLDSEWRLLRDLELGKARIPNKYKELIGIAVHAVAKCRYRALFHTEAARLFGATEEEIQEAVHYAKHTAGWSAYLNRLQPDFNAFRRELEEMGEHLSAKVEAEGELVGV